MSTDAMNAAYLSDAAYDELLKDASVDNRVGDKTALVIAIEPGQWPSGDPYTKFKFQLTDANNAKADWTFSVPPSPAEVAAQKASWKPGKLKAIASTVGMCRQLVQHYGKTPDQIKVGETLRIKTAKNKHGFIRTIAFLSPTAPAGPVISGGGSTPF